MWTESTGSAVSAPPVLPDQTAESVSNVMSFTLLYNTLTDAMQKPQLKHFDSKILIHMTIT